MRKALIKIEQTGSAIRRHHSQRETLIGLGLNRIGRVAHVPDTPEIRGMIAKVAHLVRVVHEPARMEFVSEDDLQTFEVWSKEIQGIDPAMLEPNDLAQWRSVHQDVMAKSAATPKVGLMKLHAGPGEHLYAVAIRENSKLWLTLWVRRSRKGEIFVMIPRGDRGWDPHLSYHLDGTVHSKSFNHKFGLPEKRQPLNEGFKGTEHLGMFAGHGKSIGAICNPADFSGVVEVEPGVLGPRHGWVAVDLVEPNCEPMDLTTINARIVKQAVFSHALPWVVIRVGQHAELTPASKGAASIEPA